MTSLALMRASSRAPSVSSPGIRGKCRPPQAEVASCTARRSAAIYLGTQISEQRAAGADTLITAIADATVDGTALTHDEQVQMILLLVLAGHETTLTSIATMLYLLATVEGLRQRVTEDPALIPAMIDECLRIEGPTIVMSRVARHDTHLSGQPVAKGERVALILSCANRDPQAFDRPNEFHCPREDNPHLAFGHGIHRCVGEHLAKLQIRILAEEALRLMPHYRLAENHQPTWLPGRMMRGLATLPLTP
jgi:cytochrome P450